MALSFHPTTAPLFGHLPTADMSFLQDPEVTDALLGFVYDPLDPANAALDDLLNLPLHDDDKDAAAFLRPLHDDRDGEVERHCAKKQRACGDSDGEVERHRAKKQHACGDSAWRGLADIDSGAQLYCNGGGNQRVPALPELQLNEFVLPLPLPPPPPPRQKDPGPIAFVRAADAKKAAGNVSQSVQSAAARQRRKRISEKTAQLSRLIPGGHKINTAEMLEAAARHVKLLQAQVGMLALMRTEKEKMPPMALEQMHKLLVRGDVQERLAAEGKCLVPRKLVDAVARDNSVTSNALVNRDLGRFVASLPAADQ